MRGRYAVLAKLARVQVRRPWAVIVLVLATLLPAAHFAAQLTLKSSFAELLPSNAPSVVEKRRIEGRLAASSTLAIVLMGGDVHSLERAVDELVAHLRRLDRKLVTSVDFGPRDLDQFIEKNKHLYVDLAKLQQIHDQVKDAYDAQVQKAAGLDLGLDEDEDPGEADFAHIEQDLKAQAASASSKRRGKDGYYIGDVHGLTALVLVRTPLSGLDPGASELESKVQQIVRDVNPSRFDPSIHVGYTGNLITAAEEHDAIVRDLQHVGTWGVALILAVVFLFFLRVRVLFAMCLTILVGGVWAFGVAKISVGYLNTATGFLVSIIAGNGINFGIIYMARYIDARRDDHLSVEDAVALAHRETAGATLAASAAAVVAYGSLAVTDFRGFRHFGVIAGAGMMLCWLATYVFLPAFLVVTERLKPMFESEAAWRVKMRGIYGYPFAWLSERGPRVVTLVGLGAAAVSTVLTVRFVAKDPMEYDMRKVRSDRLGVTSARSLGGRLDKIVGRDGQEGRAILVDRLEQVKPLVTELLRRRDAAPAKKKPFSRVVSVYDLLPRDQEKKIELLKDMRHWLEVGKRRRMIKQSDYERFSGLIPDNPAPLEIADLPDVVARPFTESNGTRGRIVYIVPTEGRSVQDAHYLSEWADSFRAVPLPNGDVIRGTGDPVIFADMLESIRKDAPKAITVSVLGTLAVILLAFRGRKSALIALGSLCIGLVWLVAFLALRGIKLNFLNFIALPISVGVGADYALNIVKRYEIAGDRELRRVMLETGGAVVLCSMTTTLGYLALLLSINGAVRSFGLAAAAGEITTLLAAVLLIPSALVWRARAAR